MVQTRAVNCVSGLTYKKMHNQISRELDIRKNNIIYPKSIDIMLKIHLQFRKIMIVIHNCASGRFKIRSPAFMLDVR